MARAILCLENPENRGINLKIIFRMGIFTLVALQLSGQFLPFDTKPAVSIVAILIFLTGFPLMSRSFRIAAGLFLALGVSMLSISQAAAEIWMSAAGSMTNIISIIAVMQTFSIPIRLGAYDEAIRVWLDQRFKGRRPLFLFITFSTHLLTSFLNLGSIPVLVSLFTDTLKRRMSNHERFFASAATRGYVLAALWSPGAVNLYLVVQATGLSWSRVVVPGILLAMIGFILSFVLELQKNGLLHSSLMDGKSPAVQSVQSPAVQLADRQTGSIHGSPEGPCVDPDGANLAVSRYHTGQRNPKSRVWHIVVVVFGFVLTVAVLEKYSIGLATSRAVTAGAIAVLVWMIPLIRRPGLSVILNTYWQDGLLKTADIAPFFVAMGLFSGALENSGVMDLLGPGLQSASVFLGGGTVILIGLLIILGSLVGLHPFITIVMFGKVLMHAELPVPALTIALGLAVGGAAAYLVSPFAGVMMTVSKLLGAKASDVALRWNWRFGLLFYAVGMAFSFLWGAAYG